MEHRNLAALGAAALSTGALLAAPAASATATPEPQSAPATTGTNDADAGKALACNPGSRTGTLVDSENLYVTTPYGTVHAGTVFLYYDAPCRAIRAAVQSSADCGVEGYYCLIGELWRATPSVVLRQSVEIPSGGNKVSTAWYDDAGVTHYGKAIAPLTSVSPVTTVATSPY